MEAVEGTRRQIARACAIPGVAFTPGGPMAPVLAQLPIENGAAPIAALPRRADAQRQALRTLPEQYITLHYSGVAYTDRSAAAERRAILAEAREHLRRNWERDARKPPIYADRYMYDVAVLTDGTILWLNHERVQLWHCRNALGNSRSWSVHVLLGPDQVLSIAQADALSALLEALCLEGRIPRANVVGHNEWPPASSAPPEPSATYRVLRGQSECPGRVLHTWLARWRSGGRATLAPPIIGDPAGITEHTTLVASPRCALDRLHQAFMGHTRRGYVDQDIHRTIIPEYWRVCLEGGIDPLLVVAQLIKETSERWPNLQRSPYAPLCSYWSQRPHRNPAGIGVTGRWSQEAQPGYAYNSDRKRYEQGLSFPSWKDDAVPAHVGRLLAYALPLGAENDAQRALIEKALSYRGLPDTMRGSAPTLKPLGKAHNHTGQGWASPGTDYGRSIATIANAILAQPE